MEIQRFWWLERLSVGMVLKQNPWLWKALGYVFARASSGDFSCVLSPKIPSLTRKSMRSIKIQKKESFFLTSLVFFGFSQIFDFCAHRSLKSPPLRKNRRLGHPDRSQVPRSIFPAETEGWVPSIFSAKTEGWVTFFYLEVRLLNPCYTGVTYSAHGVKEPFMICGIDRQAVITLLAPFMFLARGCFLHLAGSNAVCSKL